MGTELNSHEKVLVLDDNKPEDIARAIIEGGQQKEPFYVFDLDEVCKRVEHFKEMMPRISIFYAMKANDADKVIKLAAELGLGFDCSTPGEIYKILNLGVSPQSIIFALPNKAPEWMMYAKASGVQHTTFDSPYELQKIKRYWPEARLLIRIRIISESVYMLGEKYGCDYETDALDLLEEAAALGLRVVGVAFHVGSICCSIGSHVEGLRQARALFDHETRAGRGMNIVDIGGGFLSERTDIIDEVSEQINSTLQKLFPEPCIQIIAEPGRYICESVCCLYCNINSIRRVQCDGEIVNMIYLNDGLYGTLRYTESWHTVKIFERHGETRNGQLEKAILWGPSCDSVDRVMENMVIMLPRCIPTDWLIFNAKGAYTISLASPFSCLPKPQHRTVISKQMWEKIKDSKVFSPEEFDKHFDISTPFPSSLPPLIKKAPFLKTNTLKI